MIRLFILLLSLLKLGKVGGAALTMALSIAIYASIWGWRFAVGFVALIFVHEMGHFLAARERGLNVGLPTFIPFVGAWIQLREQPMNVETEAYVASAGPFVGSIGATAVYLWARHSDSMLLLAIAYSGFFINFFNLIPLSPLDGGRMTAILSPRVWFIGAPLMVALMFYRPSPLLIVIAVVSIPSLIQAWKYDPTSPEAQAYYATPIALKLQYGTFYLGLAAYLAIMTSEVHGMLQNHLGS